MPTPLTQAKADAMLADVIPTLSEARELLLDVDARVLVGAAKQLLDRARKTIAARSPVPVDLDVARPADPITPPDEPDAADPDDETEL